MRLVLVSLLVTLHVACVADGAESSEDVAAASDEAGGKADSLTEVSGVLYAALPVLGSPRVQNDSGPGFTHVQPTASLVFTYSSCAARSWAVTRETQASLDGQVVLLALTDENPIDCFGPSISREYAVQISTDASVDTNFALLNPSGLRQ